MIKTGLCSVTFRELPTDKVIELAQKVNIASIEWGADVHVPPNNLTQAQEIADQTQQAGLEVSSYGSYYRVGNENEFSFESVLQTAVHIRAPSIRVWAGSLGSKEASESDRKNVVHDTKRIASLAQDEGIFIDFEYHGGTLTDTRESAAQLMNDVNHKNVRIYWQPAVGESVESRIQDIQALEKWISHIHVFHWVGKDRFPLGDGMNEWSKYIESLPTCTETRYAMLEFVKDNDSNQFLKDAAVLHKLVSN